MRSKNTPSSSVSLMPIQGVVAHAGAHTDEHLRIIAAQRAERGVAAADDIEHRVGHHGGRRAFIRIGVHGDHTAATGIGTVGPRLGQVGDGHVGGDDARFDQRDSHAEGRQFLCRHLAGGFQCEFRWP